MRAGLWIAALAISATAPQVHSGTLYVIEQLIVSVNASADGSGERIAQIHSGDPVELLEQEGEQAHVRLASGAEGWLKASYLSADLPLQQQLSARSDELEQARREKKRLETQLAAARQAATAAAADNASKATAASPSGPPLFSFLADSSGTALPARPTWLWALVASLVALVAGFALGWRMLDRRIRAKYGGLRIY
jgi:hypothetical protein